MRKFFCIARTGGIRCEKASAYMIEKGFTDVNQLEGGIVEYVNEVRKQGVEPLFKGVNFVFDERMTERVTEDILSVCGNCGKPADTPVNCENQGCHVLFVQCEDCSEKFDFAAQKSVKSYGQRVNDGNPYLYSISPLR